MLTERPSLRTATHKNFTIQVYQMGEGYVPLIWTPDGGHCAVEQEVSPHGFARTRLFASADAALAHARHYIDSEHFRA
jgi:hypothetical protein